MKTKYSTPNVIDLQKRQKDAMHDNLVDVCKKHKGLVEIKTGYYLVDSSKFTIKQKD